MVASLPDCTIMPLMSVSTGICVPTCAKVREPSAFHACSLMVTLSLRSSRFSCNARYTPYPVMSLVMLAGSLCTSALKSASTRPLWKSTST